MFATLNGLGGPRLFAGLKKDGGQQRTITVATPLVPVRILRNSPGTNSRFGPMALEMRPLRSGATRTKVVRIPRPKTSLQVHEIEIRPRVRGWGGFGHRTGQSIRTLNRVRRMGKERQEHSRIAIFDPAHWTPATSIQLELVSPKRKTINSGNYQASTPQGTAVQVSANQMGFYTSRIRAFQTPQANLRPSFFLKVSYTTSQTL